MFLIRIYFWFTDREPPSLSAALGFKTAHPMADNRKCHTAGDKL